MKILKTFGIATLILSIDACETVCPKVAPDLRILEGRPKKPVNLNQAEVLESLEKIIRYALELDIHVDTLHEYIHSLNKETERLTNE